jgi:DNA-binding FadR family transcriptional regulator
LLDIITPMASGSVRADEPRVDVPVVRERVPKASDVVAARLRGRILGEAMAAGTELPSEAELIESHGFSRSTVREALRLLEADGLIVTKRGPGGGIRVSRPDINQISRSMAILFTTQSVTHREFLTFRTMLEPPMAALAARSATTEQREWLLAQANHEQTTYSGVGGSVGFHEAIGVCTNNGVVRAVLAAMESALEGHVVNESLSSDDIEGTIRVHVRIAELISAGKAEEAETAMLRHLEAFISSVDRRGRLDDLAVSRSFWQSK